MVKRDIRDYLNDILTHIDLAKTFIQDITFEEFQNDDKMILALTRAVEIASEATKQIPGPLREQYSEITWKEVTGMRDRLAHVYFGIDLQTVWDTTLENLPELRPVIQKMLDNLMSAEDSEPI